MSTSNINITQTLDIYVLLKLKRVGEHDDWAHFYPTGSWYVWFGLNSSVLVNTAAGHIPTTQTLDIHVLT